MAYAAITKPNLHFNLKLYTGTGSSNALTGIGHQPDLVWIKDRSEANWHNLYDVVRGVTKRVFTNQNNAEETQAQGLTAFGTDGFTVGSNVDVNKSGNNYVAWSWKASNSTGSANNDGSIATTVAANTTAGFSIVKWTGTGSAGTLGHGLGAVPHTIWVKKTSQADDWFCWHTALGAQGKINFNNTSAVQNDTGYWNNTTPTNQVFSVTSNGANNASGQTYIAYCFTSIKGYSKFGKYTGNGSTNGPFIYTGFRPAWIMTKKISGTADWMIRDKLRLGYNDGWGDLYANTTGAEGTNDANTKSDILSNGFKLRMSHSNHNQDGGDYIYMAFAENPFVANVGTNGIPATAR